MFTTKSRYKVAYGGRGSGKSRSFALMLAVRGYAEPLRILCAREFQVSLKNSSFAEIVSAIQSIPFLDNHYECGVNYIKGANGTEFIFSGLAVNPHSVKSLSNIDICFIEEAETVSERSWNLLLPTIRAEGSQIWIVFNPERKDSPTNIRFIQNPPDDAIVVKINYMDNQFFPKTLDQERLHDLKRDPDMYRHVWLGECITNTDAQIFKKKWRVDTLETKGADGPYFGVDWGSVHPTTITKTWVIDNKIIYIEKEAGGSQLTFDEMVEVFDSIPGARDHAIQADSSQPAMIAHMKSKGFKRMMGVKKYAGSVVDGLTFMKSYEIIIDPSCVNAIKEFGMYSYKVDRLSGEVLPVIIALHDDYIDSIRYSLTPIILRKKGGILSTMG